MSGGVRRALGPAAAVALLAAAAEPADDPYSRLIYDYEVALICGLGSQAMQDAYAAARARLEAALPLDADALTERRIQAMAAADLEYANRGLGGFRPWCADEGTAGVRRILETAND